jgi:hypothetical protein
MKKPIKIAIFLVSAVIFCSLLLFVFRRHTVLFTLHEAGDVNEEPAFIVFNPFRDRNPESTAEHFMRLLSSEQCLGLVSPIRGEYAGNICEREQKFISTQFRLTSRKDTGDSVDVSFEVKRQNSPASVSRLTIRRVNQVWKVIDYQPVY